MQIYGLSSALFRNYARNRREVQSRSNISYFMNIMSRSLKRLCFVITVLALASPSIHAQDSNGIKFLIGPIGSYNKVSYKTNTLPFTTESSPDLLGIFQNGSGWDPSFGISCEIPMSKDIHSFWILEALYDSKSANFGTVADATVADTTYSLGATLSYILVNVGFKYDFMTATIPSGLGIQLCASIGIKYSAIFDPSSTPPKHFGTLGVVNDALALRFALRPEITYDMPLSALWIITPSLGYDAPLTKVDQNSNWSASSGYGAIALRYAFGSF